MKKKFEKLDKLEFVIEHIIVIMIIILAFSFNIMNYNRIEGLAQVKNSILNQENQDSKATYHGAWHETLDIKKVMRLLKEFSIQLRDRGQCLLLYSAMVLA